MMTTHQVPLADNLARDAAAARRQGQIVLLEVSASYCGFCDQLETEILQPMLLSGDYDDCVRMRRISVDSAQGFRDFSGASVTGEEFAQRYRAGLTPTLLFLDIDGHELTDRMVGINTVEFYGYYLDESLRAAIDRAAAGRRMCGRPILERRPGA